MHFQTLTHLWQTVEMPCTFSELHLELHSLFTIDYNYSSDIDMYPKDNDVLVKVNGLEVPINNLPYQHATGFLLCLIKSKPSIFTLT